MRVEILIILKTDEDHCIFSMAVVITSLADRVRWKAAQATCPSNAIKSESITALV